jgi:hypothetical protein
VTRADEAVFRRRSLLRAGPEGWLRLLRQISLQDKWICLGCGHEPALSEAQCRFARIAVAEWTRSQRRSSVACAARADYRRTSLNNFRRVRS